MNVMGPIKPCHNPAQKPAGTAPGRAYLELGPATASTFAIPAPLGEGKLRNTPEGTAPKLRATARRGKRTPTEL